MIERVNQDRLAAPPVGHPWGIGVGGCGYYNAQTWGYQHDGKARYYYTQHVRLRFGVGNLVVAQVNLRSNRSHSHWEATVALDNPDVRIVVATRWTGDQIARIAWATNPPANAWASLEVCSARGWAIEFDTRLPHDVVRAMSARDSQNALRAMSCIPLVPAPTFAPTGPWGIERTAVARQEVFTAGEVFTEGWGLW